MSAMASWLGSVPLLPNTAFVVLGVVAVAAMTLYQFGKLG